MRRLWPAIVLIALVSGLLLLAPSRGSSRPSGPVGGGGDLRIDARRDQGGETATSRPAILHRFQAGVCWVGPEHGPSLDYLRERGIGWISVTPFAYGHERADSPPEGGYRFSRYRGESIEGVRAVIQGAHRSGLKVMLKPHIWFAKEGVWRSSIAMKTEEDWRIWFGMYGAFLAPFVKMAALEGVEILCLGTELTGTIGRDGEWRALIRDVRKRYGGRLTYAANWYQEYEEIPFWDALDAIGVQAYFPLGKKEQPTVEEICASWEPWRRKLAALARRHRKPILFTELGYKPSAGTTIEPWTWRAPGPTDPGAQERAFRAAFQALAGEEWLRGMYVWKWYAGYVGPEGDGAPRRRHHDNFSPQGYPAERTILEGFRRLQGAGPGAGAKAERKIGERSHH